MMPPMDSSGKSLKQLAIEVSTPGLCVFSVDVCAGEGLSNNISSIPAAVTDVRMTPRVTQECLWIRSSSRNRKKETRFPITPESSRMVQNIPEFLVIVPLSELFVRKVP